MLKTLIDAFATCDFVGKTIVFALVAMSVYAWWKIFNKFFTLATVKRDDRSFMRRYNRNAHPAQFWLQVTARRPFPKEVPCGAIYSDAMTELLGFLRRAGVTDQEIASWPQDRTGPVLPESEMASVRAAAENALSRQSLALEAGMSTLATCTSVAPSLGLFGTVWGIMVAFMGMVSNTSAIVISNVAPGIAGALLTTVAGLFVSIPTVAVYNHLSATVRKCTVDQETFTDQLLADIVRVHGGAGTAPAAQPVAAPVVIQTAPAPAAYVPQYGIPAAPLAAQPAAIPVAPVAAAPQPAVAPQPVQFQPQP